MTHHEHQQEGQTSQQGQQLQQPQQTPESPQSSQIGGGQFGSSQQMSGGQPMGGQQVSGQQQGGQSMGGQQMGGQQMGLRLQDVQSPQERAALDAVVHGVEVCGFCADQCIQEADPHMVECIRRCEDVVELGETVLALLPRQSPQAGPVLQAFQQAAQACAQECGQHQHAHCQDCARVLWQAVDAIQQYLGQGGQQMAQQQQTQPTTQF
jgi:hypothetical protein